MSLKQNLLNATNKVLFQLFNLDSLPSADGKRITKPSDMAAAIDNAISSLGTNNYMFNALDCYLKSESERQRCYKEYDTMDDASDVISTGLDIYAEDATDFDTFINSRVWITANDSAIATETNEWLKAIKLEKNLPKIARNLAKYGDFFLNLQYEKEEKNTNNRRNQTTRQMSSEIVRIDTSYYPGDVMPIVKNYHLLGFFVSDQEKARKATSNNLYAPWEFIHFAIPGDSNFMRYNNTSTMTQRERENQVEYGQSLLRAARRPYKRSSLMHDILAIARMTRSPLRRIFKFMTETDNPTKAITDLAVFKKVMEKIGGVDKASEDMSYSELMNVMTNDVYLPILKDAKGDYSFETVGGDVDVSNIVDIEMWDNRLFMALRIPKEYMNFSEAMGDRSTLLLKDIRYAKRIKKLQSAIKEGIRELVFIYWALKGKTLTEHDFDVNMASTSISEDLERLDYFGNAISTADALTRMLESFGEDDEGAEDDESPAAQKKPIDKGYLVYYILKNIVKLPEFDIVTFFPGAQKYIDKEEELSKEEKNKKRSTEELVENNKKFIQKKFNEKFGQDLKEAAEALNANLIKEYRKENPKLEKFDYSNLLEYCNSVVLKASRKTKRGAK